MCLKFGSGGGVFLLVRNCFKLITRSKKMNVNYTSAPLKLSNYDCIGFDLDHTLCVYNLNEICNLEYDLMKNRLIQLGYKDNYLSQPLIDNVDFIRRGLILDIEKGNLLDITCDGTIVKASHGTRMLSNAAITDIYGSDRRWHVTDTFTQEPLATWEGPLSEKLRSVLDYFDIIVPLVYGRAINCVDSANNENDPLLNDYTQVWKDILDTLNHMYSREHFDKNVGGYFEAVKANPSRYIKKRSPEFLNWLKKMKNSKTTFLITGSDMDYASMIAETSLGKDWQTFFDVIVCYARKPGFFIGNRPLVKIVFDEQLEQQSTNQSNKFYSQGNWAELYDLLKLNTAKDNPLCLYMGDNLLQDIYAPTQCSRLDTVAVVREVYDEITVKRAQNSEDDIFTSSSLWGSYFKCQSENKLTVWGNIVRSHSKICVPDLSVFINNPIDYSYDVFEVDDLNDNTKGYYLPREFYSNAVNCS